MRLVRVVRRRVCNEPHMPFEQNYIIRERSSYAQIEDGAADCDPRHITIFPPAVRLLSSEPQGWPIRYRRWFWQNLWQVLAVVVLRALHSLIGSTGTFTKRESSLRAARPRHGSGAHVHAESLGWEVTNTPDGLTAQGYSFSHRQSPTCGFNQPRAERHQRVGRDRKRANVWVARYRAT